jgi:hypothetical protein
MGTQRINTTAATVFDEEACAGLKNGDTIAVSGLRQGDGAIVAAEIKR